MYSVRHKSVKTPSSQDGGRGTHVMHFVQLYPQPLYTASQVRTTCRSWDEGVLTDLCLTGVLTDLCLTLYFKCRRKIISGKIYSSSHESLSAVKDSCLHSYTRCSGIFAMML